jgi:hypothetical protein
MGPAAASAIPSVAITYANPEMAISAKKLAVANQRVVPNGTGTNVSSQS